MLSIAAEPASILYIVSGAIGFLFIRNKPTRPASTLMLVCKRATHEKLQQLRLTGK